MSEIEKKAVQLAGQGFRVFPLHTVWNGCCTCGDLGCSSPGKHPRVGGWQEKASSDPTTVSKNFRLYQQANVGIVTGKGLVVVDVDGPEGEHSLTELEVKHGTLPITLTSSTGRGRHLLYRCLAGMQIKNKVALAPHLDIRGDGGYIVGPGSTHVNGKRYAWKDENAAIGDAPNWVARPNRSQECAGRSQR